MNHVSVSPTDGNGPTQGQRKTLTSCADVDNDSILKAEDRQVYLFRSVGPCLVQLFSLDSKTSKSKALLHQCNQLIISNNQVKQEGYSGREDQLPNYKACVLKNLIFSDNSHTKKKTNGASVMQRHAQQRDRTVSIFI